MEAHELAEKLRNSTKTEQNFQDIVKWCGENDTVIKSRNIMR